MSNFVHVVILSILVVVDRGLLQGNGPGVRLSKPGVIYYSTGHAIAVRLLLIACLKLVYIPP